MRRIAELMTPEWVDRELASRFGEGVPPGLRASLTEGLLQSNGGSEPEARWGSEARRCMTRVALEYARGSSAQEIRGICRDFGTRFADEAVPTLDFTERELHVEGGMAPSAARELAETYDGTWWKSDQYYAGVRYRAMGQPFSLVMPKVWMIAAVAGDPQLAERVAKPYRLHKPEQIKARYQVRDAILRHALAGDTEGEQVMAGRLEPGYIAGFPPNLIEFPLAVQSRDGALLASAVRKMSMHFKGKWEVKRHRTFYDKQVKKYGLTGWRAPPTWERFLDQTRGALLDADYVISWWALAWLNVARWRGIEDLFGNVKLFSEWVPLSFCE